MMMMMVPRLALFLWWVCTTASLMLTPKLSASMLAPKFGVSVAQAYSPDVQELLVACKAVQSQKARRRVEECILRLQEKASKKQNVKLRQSLKLGAAYRTIWSTVTASTLIGAALRQAPNQILCGDAWQVISNDGKRAENIVYWSLFGLPMSARMAGLADLEPLQASNGYDLVIKGLEFRFGEKGYLPEVYVPADESSSRSSLRVFYLEDGKELDNGRGTLEILYFDGQLRISRDSVQNNTYVHLLEPLGSSLFPDVVSPPTATAVV
jgi:hypothetical protein